MRLEMRKPLIIVLLLFWLSGCAHFSNSANNLYLVSNCGLSDKKYLSAVIEKGTEFDVVLTDTNIPQEMIVNSLLFDMNKADWRKIDELEQFLNKQGVAVVYDYFGQYNHLYTDGNLCLYVVDKCDFASNSRE